MRCGHALMLLSLLSPATSIAADFAISYLFPALAGASLHSSPGLATLALRFQILAGAEGFEPPSSVLETDSLTVELTPLNQHLAVSLSHLVLLTPTLDAKCQLLNATSLPCATCACGTYGKTY